MSHQSLQDIRVEIFAMEETIDRTDKLFQTTNVEITGYVKKINQLKKAISNANYELCNLEEEVISQVDE